MDLTDLADPRKLSIRNRFGNRVVSSSRGFLQAPRSAFVLARLAQEGNRLRAALDAQVSRFSRETSYSERSCAASRYQLSCRENNERVPSGGVIEITAAESRRVRADREVEIEGAPGREGEGGGRSPRASLAARAKTEDTIRSYERLARRRRAAVVGGGLPNVEFNAD